MSDLAKRNIAWVRISYFLLALAASTGLTALFGGKISNDPQLLGVIAAIFAILSGVLIAIISILGDPSMIMDKSWRLNYLTANETQRKLHRKIDVFVLYIALLAGVFWFALVDDKASSIYWWLQRAVFFLTVASFFASLSLPFSLIDIQKKRLQSAINQMKVAPKDSGAA